MHRLKTTSSKWLQLATCQAIIEGPSSVTVPSDRAGFCISITFNGAATGNWITGCSASKVFKLEVQPGAISVNDQQIAIVQVMAEVRRWWVGTRVVDSRDMVCRCSCWIAARR